MTTSSEVQTFARALYESLISTAVKQLRSAEPKLADLDESDPDIQKRVKAAAPSGTSSEVRNFLMTVVREGARDRLPEIIDAFARYAEGDEGVQELDAEVTSAVPLSDTQQQSITEDLRKRYNQQLQVKFSVDESLIGGLIIRVGDQVLDNSLRVRLNAVQRSMLSS